MAISPPSCSYCIWNRCCWNRRRFLPNFLFFLKIVYCWIQSPAVSKRQDVGWRSFCWSLPLSIDYVWETDIDIVISTPSCSYCIWNRYCQNHRRILPNFLFFIIIYGWTQATAESKRRDVRWYSFRWLIPLSIDNVWESRMDWVISTPSCSYCIWNRCCWNRRRFLPNFLFFFKDCILLNSIACRV